MIVSVGSIVQNDARNVDRSRPSKFDRSPYTLIQTRPLQREDDNMSSRRNRAERRGRGRTSRLESPVPSSLYPLTYPSFTLRAPCPFEALEARAVALRARLGEVGTGNEEEPGGEVEFVEAL